ncbi:MAG: CapA family protein [Paludibacteraceae bacterium]|nr:CapA family protein [Paludibacteraceae bacterium]
MKLLFAGDFVPHHRISELFKNNDFSALVQISKITNNADYSIVNLEAPIVRDNASPIFKTGPNLKCDESAMAALKYAGFNCVTLANNHFYDYGDIGVKNTLDLCIANDIDYIGGGINLSEAKKTLYKNIQNKKIAFINCCEQEWSIATPNTGGSAPLDIINLYYQITTERKNNDYVILIIHGGTEEYNNPTPRMKKLYRFFIDLGVDCIINHHQHCLCGYEIYKDKPIFYGLGNFCFDWEGKQNSSWNQGYMVLLNIDENISFNLIPYEQCSSTPFIKILNDKEKLSFLKEIESLNKIIDNDELLDSKFQELVMNRQKNILLNLEPFNNIRIIKKLKELKIIPYSLTKSKKALLLNLIRCDAHKDILLKILN